ncbi:AraC family transcriptional regulator [Gracilibacillus thailandensis]|uniref:Helix-turn-helix domain-containing protein n=1 Tax=Gracilibacillus thailandensis TaxID=563735 RepID=A0A6N7QWD6_9BACI|nr:helix-turn-helix domain-containing protein [Gracilibacillus thailandensis]MRI66433.1 helix-turn-helix domain-containing protein [Gracilibacillus thailandensis]
MNFWTKIRNWIDNRWSSKYFRKSFLMILFITSIPGIVSAIGIYTFGLYSTEEELRKIHVEEINDRAQNIDDQFTYLEESLSYWAFEPIFNSQLTNMDYVSEFQKTRDLKQKLLILQGSHPLIDEVELFVNGRDPILLSPYLSFIKDHNMEDAYQSLLLGSQNVTWDQEEQFIENTKYTNDIVLTHQIPGVVNHPFGAIIVKIDKQKLASLIETLTPYSDGFTMLFNQDNEVLLSTAESNHEDLANVLSNELNKNQNKSSSFQLDWENETFSVSSGQFDRIGSTWTYVSAAPITAITSPIVTISKVIMVASLSILILAFLMTWFASNRLYKPVRNLVNSLTTPDKQKVKTDEFKQIHEQFHALTDERRHLEERLSEQIPQLRQNFLVQLTKGYLYDYSENALKQRMEKYGWSVKDHTFVLLDIQLTGMYDADKVNEEDDSLLTFAMANIAEDITKEQFQQYTILNNYDLSAGIFLIVPNNKESLPTSLHKLAENITEAINKVLALKVTITISSKTEQVKQISHLFEEIGRGKRYREFENQNQIIHLNELQEREYKKKLYYPFELEKEIIQCIRRGRTNETEAFIRQFFNYLVENGNKELNVQASIMQLYSTIQHEILHSGIDPTVLYNGRNMYEELAQIREREWIVRWLVDKVIQPYVDFVENNMNIEMKHLVDEVTLYIHENYMEDISLEICADQADTTAYTLSKAFKKVLGINFIDYLTRIRLDQAKELLMNSNLKINEIAESVGYRHSYFNRIFKKHVGVPPSQYRKIKSNSS